MTTIDIEWLFVLKGDFLQKKETQINFFCDIVSATFGKKALSMLLLENVECSFAIGTEFVKKLPKL